MFFLSFLVGLANLTDGVLGFDLVEKKGLCCVNFLFPGSLPSNSNSLWCFVSSITVITLNADEMCFYSM